MELEHGSGSSKHSRRHPEVAFDDDDNDNDESPLVQAKLSNTSSTSSSSSFDPLLDSDGEKDINDNSISKSEDFDTNSPTPEPVTSPKVSSHTPNWSMVSDSPMSPRSGLGPVSSPEVSAQTPDWGVSPKQSPPIQTMGRPSGYDPNRIPSSVFASKPATPMEWSVASNESLFSIHMGNNSFSRDHAILLGKSGELLRPDEFNYALPGLRVVTDTKPDELNNSLPELRPVTDTKPNDSNNFPPSLPTVIESGADSERRSADTAEDSTVKDAVDETRNLVWKESGEDHSREKMPMVEVSRTSASTPRLSDESGNSSSSFAFPVLDGESERSASVKVVTRYGHNINNNNTPPVHQQQQPETPEGTPKIAETNSRWFSCFSCRPLCC